MALVLPSTVEELNFINSTGFILPPPPYVKDSNKGFENIAVERRYKREVSLPNGVENWNISNFDPYLNFDDNIQQITYKAITESQDDRLVPEEGELRQRCESFSSVSSSMDDKSVVFHSGVKTFSTVCVDSGSTCISSDHTYGNPSTTLYKGLIDVEETYQNLDTFFKQEPEIPSISTIHSISPVGSPMNDSNLEYSVLSNFSVSTNGSQDSLIEQTSGSKRSASDLLVDDEIFLLSSGKRTCESPNGGRYVENRKKNNIASKNCRKTRKEKQKDMEKRVSDLEKERSELTVEVEVLEEMIQAHKLKLYAILQKR